MYGSTSSPEPEDVPLAAKYDPTKKQEYSPETNPFNEDWSESFWKEVDDLHGDGSIISFNDALNKIRLKYIKKKFESEGQDSEEMYHILEILKVYKKYCDSVGDENMVASFRQQISVFIKRLLKEDFDSSTERTERRYGKTIPIPGEGEKTILHLAAEKGLLEIAKYFLELNPGFEYVPTSGENYCGITEERLPVELAIENGHDNTAAFLVKKMKRVSRVRELFEASELLEAPLNFVRDVINNPKNMEKTVIALLDANINPYWPCFPEVKSLDEKEEMLSKISDVPTRYHFYYRMLDSDSNGEPPKIINGEVNSEFNHHKTSVLHNLLCSEYSKSIISHPVVRMLVDRKWKKFGRKEMFIRCGIFLIYLLLMSIALFIDNEKLDLNVYETKLDYFRGTCEILTLIFAAVYVISEIDQMEKERCNYLNDYTNYLDLFGSVLIFVLVPLRFADQSNHEWSVASVAYLINVLRVMKYFPAQKKIGQYSKTVIEMIKYDISKFAFIYAIVMLAFTGSVFLAIKASMFSKGESLKFFNVMLREVRALTEANPFQDDYDTFNTGVIILLMLNMFTIIVILTNILIGQLSCRYAQALQDGEKQYCIDKAKFIVKLERSRFRKRDRRMECYKEGDYVSDEKLVGVLLEDWVNEQKAKEKGISEAITYMKNNYTNVDKDQREKIFRCEKCNVDYVKSIQPQCYSAVIENSS